MADNAAQVHVTVSSSCQQHGKQCVFVCEKCCELACFDCATQTHKGHDLEALSAVIPDAKHKLLDYVNKAELIQLPKVKEMIIAADCDLCESKNYYKNQIIKIEDQNEMLKKKLDDITKTLIKMCQDMEAQSTEALMDYKKQLQVWSDELNSQLEEVKNTLQIGSDFRVFNVSKGTPATFKELPTAPSNIAEFIPGECSLSKLEELFGELSITAPRSEPMVKGKLSQQAEQQHQAATVMSKFNLDKNRFVKSMQPACNSQVWASFLTDEGYCSSEVELLDTAGKIQKTIQMEKVVTDFALSSKTNDIWYCSYDDNNVRERSKETSTVKFRADICASSICMTQDGGVVLGYGRKMVKYTKCFQIICETSEGCPPQVRYPYHISECPLTKHLAVVDWDWAYYGGSDTPCVSIFDQNLRPLYCYLGKTPDNQSPRQPFKPCDACYTKDGKIVVTDTDNRSVLLLSNKAEYIQTLCNYQESEPRAVCCHNNGSVWISFTDGSVHVLKEI